MSRLLLWSIAGGSVLAATVLAFVMAEPVRGPEFIPGDRPVTEDQVRQKLESDGWSNVQISHEGRYFEAVASKDGQNARFAVDSQTGRLRADDDDDDDDD